MKSDKNKKLMYKRAVFGVTAACALGVCIMTDTVWTKKTENTKDYKQTDNSEEEPELWTLSLPDNVFEEKMLYNNEKINDSDKISDESDKAKDNNINSDIVKEEKSFDIVISKCNEYVNIRKEPSADSEIVGRLYKDSYGTIIERAEGWTKISSGKVKGYVNNEYLYMDEEAKKLIDTKKLSVTKITAGTVNIRAGAGTDTNILKEAVIGTEYPSIVEMSVDGWNAIEYEGKTAYVSAEFSEETYNMKTAVTQEYIKAQEEEKAEKEREKKAAQALASAKNVKVTSISREPISISDEEIYLMSVVIASEALSESYEGKLAVANVIINRMLAGYWGTTISSVVYAPGQFSGASTGRFERYEKLVNEDCKRAAIEALAGNNNIDDFLYFRMKETAQYEKYSKYYIIGGHCFYMPK